MTKLANAPLGSATNDVFPASGDGERRLADLGLIGFWDCNFRTKRVRVSPELARFFGLLCFEERECDLSDLAINIPPGDQLWSNYWRPLAIDSTGVGTIQYRVCDEQAGIRWVMCRGRYEMDADGAITRGHGVVFDVTAAKQEGKRIVSPEDRACDPVDHLADLLIEAHGVASTMTDNALSGALSAALMRVGTLLARRLTAEAKAAPLH